MNRKTGIVIGVAAAAVLVLLLLFSAMGSERSGLTRAGDEDAATAIDGTTSIHRADPQRDAEASATHDGLAEETRVVQGRVIDEADRAISGAEIKLLAHGREEVTTQSGGDGSFEAEVGEVLPLLVSATAEGYLRGAMTIRRYEPHIEIVLRKGRQISGRVLRGGEPVSGATVVAGVARTTSGEGGVFMLENLPSGPVFVEARRHMMRSEPMRLDLSTGPIHGLALQLREGGSIEVRVRTGEEIPVPNARVTVSPIGWDETFELFTGDDGNVLFESIPSGSLRLVAAAEGLASNEKNTDIPEGGRKVAWINLSEAHAVVVDTRLDRGSPERGETVTLRLVPAEGSVVQETMLHQQTAGIGEPAVFDSVATGSWRAIAHHPSYSAEPVPVEVPGPDVTIVLQTGGEVSGRVVDEQGAVIAGAFVLASPVVVPGAPRTDLRPARRGRSGAGGEFRIEGLVGEAWRLIPRMPGYSFGEPVAVRPGDTNVLLRMENARSISGQVVDGRGAHHTSVRVVARAMYGERRRVARTATDEQGEFVLDNLSAGSYELVAQRGPRGSDPAVVEAGSENVRLVIPIGSTVRGRVVGPGGVVPPRYSVLGFHFSDPSGSFVIDDLDPREGTIWADAPELLRKTIPLALLDDRVTDVGTISLDAPARIEGRVTDAEGRAVPEATVVLDLRDGDESHPAITSTDQEGNFSFSELPLGTARLQVMIDGDQSATTEEILGSGRTSQVRLVVQ